MRDTGMNKTEPFYGWLVMCHLHWNLEDRANLFPASNMESVTAGSQLMLAEEMHPHVPLVAFTDGVP